MSQGMHFTVLKVSGTDALKQLQEQRARYSTTGLYPFLIGDTSEFSMIKDNAEGNPSEPARIIQASMSINLGEWIERRKSTLDELGIDTGDLEGDWPGEVAEKGSIGLHKDVLTGKIKPEVLIGLTRIEQPWHLPAMLKYGGWNDCPEAEVQCAFHRHWYETYGTEMTGASGDIIECIVSRPPVDRKAAMALAWEQYWYCADIVEQGCESVSYLAATLLNSKYWYFWWD